MCGDNNADVLPFSAHPFSGLLVWITQPYGITDSIGSTFIGGLSHLLYTGYCY